MPPAYALLAAPTLACVVLLFTPFHPYRVPTGLRVLLPPLPCQRGTLPDRVIVLVVKEDGELFINTEPVSRADLPRRLADIYRTRAERQIFLIAEGGASFQTVADAIDTGTRIRDPEFGSLDIDVLLITPQTQAEAEKCYAITLERLGRQSSRKGHR